MLFLCLVVGLIVSIILNVFLLVLFFMQRNIAYFNWSMYENSSKNVSSLIKTLYEKMVELAEKDEKIKELEEIRECIATQFREYVDMIHNIPERACNGNG